MKHIVLLLLLFQTPTALIEHAIADLNEAKQLLVPIQVVTVGQGDNLQAAIDSLPANGIIEVSGTHVGTFRLKSGGGTLRTKGAFTGRVDPTIAAQFGKLKSPGQQQPALIMASGWTVDSLDISGDANEIILISRGVSDTKIIHNYIHGDPVTGTKRGITLNGMRTEVGFNYISDIKRKGQDTVGVGGWDGEGQYQIHDNFISASGSSILFGGADPSVQDLVTADIDIWNNELTKDVTWKGQGFGVKNILELKNARRVHIWDNKLSNSWKEGQAGFAVVLTIRNQSGKCPWCTIEDVLFENNDSVNAAGAFNILGMDNNFPSGTAKHITIKNNRMEICTTMEPLGAAARVFQIQGPLEGLNLVDNVFTKCDAGFLSTFLELGGKFSGLVATGNSFPEGEYGIHGDQPVALGKPTLDLISPGYRWEANIVKKFPNNRNIQYPAGTTVVK